MDGSSMDSSNKSNDNASNIIDCMTSPVKSRLLFEIDRRKSATAKELTAALADIPQATLYRNLKQMQQVGVLNVVGETPVRGTIEKTYAVAGNITADLRQVLDDNSGEQYLQAFTRYMLGFARQFESYCTSADIDIEADLSGFSLIHAQLTDEELVEVVQKISDILKPLENKKPGPGSKMRTIGLIVSPPQTEE